MEHGEYDGGELTACGWCVLPGRERRREGGQSRARGHHVPYQPLLLRLPPVAQVNFIPPPGLLHTDPVMDSVTMQRSMPSQRASAGVSNTPRHVLLHPVRHASSHKHVVL